MGPWLLRDSFVRLIPWVTSDTASLTAGSAAAAVQSGASEVPGSPAVLGICARSRMVAGRSRSETTAGIRRPAGARAGNRIIKGTCSSGR